MIEVLAPELPEVDAVVLAFRRNVVVAASAGTGKTHRLTALYVLLALGLTSMGEGARSRAAAPVPPDRIWATTFTRAAAGEIADRVEEALQALAADPGAERAPFAAEIAARRAELDDPPNLATLKKRAAEALARWPARHIDTLHGLAGRILDRHGLTLGLPPGMRILDEDEAAHLTALAVDEVVGRALGGGGEAAAAARALLAAAGGIGPLRAQLGRLFDRLDEEGLSPDALVLSDHEAEARAVRADLARIARAVVSDGAPTFREAASALADAFARDGGPLLPDGAYTPLVDLLTKRMPAKKRPADEELDAFRKNLGGGALRPNADRLAAFLRHASDLNLRERGIVRLLEEARATARVRRRRAGALGFGDMLRAARDGLRDLPELAESVRADVGVLLVDEFQDTSTVQRDLVYLLREREESRRARRPGDVPAAAHLERHGLFLVGDRKQSIYGFRGADVAVFSRICGELGGEAAALALRLAGSRGRRDAHADFVALVESRRSGAAVLGFVNTFCACDFAEGRGGAEARDFEVEYSDVEHLVPVRPPEERGEVVLIEDDASVPEGADALVREAEGPLREALVAAAWIACDRARTGRKASSYAVLARRRNTLPLVSVALERLGVPYVVAGRALYDAPEVRDVAALVRLMIDPRDRLSLATVLRGPVVALSDTALAALSEPGRGLVSAAIGDLPERAALLASDEARRLQTFRATFAALRRAALRAPPAEALRAIVAGFDLDRVLAALPRAEARLANVDRLVAIAAERGGSLAAFGRWLDRRIADESDEPEGVVFAEEDDAVRLLTIHGSKGLQFDVAVLVDLAAEPRPSYPGIDLVPPLGDRPASLLVRHFAPLQRVPDDEPAPLLQLPTPAIRAAQAESRAREQAERRRLTYVAATRAKDGLVLVTPATPPRGSSAWRTLSSALPPEARQRTLSRVERAADLLGAAQRLDPAAAPAPAIAPPAPAKSIAFGASNAASANAASANAASASPALASTTTASGAVSAAGARTFARPSNAPGSEGASSVRAPVASGAPAPARAPASFTGPPPAAPRTIALPTTALSLFEGCARRYRLRYLLGFDEPLASTQLELFAAREAEDEGASEVARDFEEDARDVGRAAHRVLERWPAARWGSRPAPDEIRARLVAEGIDAASPDLAPLAEGIARWLEGPYVRAVRASAATLLREEPFVLEVAGPVGLALRGAMDLVVHTADGRADVIDYKRSRPRADLSAYAFQLRAYALALRRRFPEARVRAGILFLGADEPRWLAGAGGQTEFSNEDHLTFENELARLATSYARCRAADEWDGVPLERCRKLGCGFVTACHRARGKAK